MQVCPPHPWSPRRQLVVYSGVLGAKTALLLNSIELSRFQEQISLSMQVSPSAAGCMHGMRGTKTALLLHSIEIAV